MSTEALTETVDTGTSTADRSLIPADTKTATTTDKTTSTPAVGEVWWKGWIKETGELDPTRLNHLPEDLKGAQSILSRFRKADDFFKSFAHAQQLVSQKGLTPLRPDATADEKTDHMKRLAQVTGAPEKPEGYGIKHENPEIQKQYDEFAKVFHKWALPPEAVKELVMLNEGIQKQAIEAFETEQARAEDAKWNDMQKQIDREFGPFKQEKFAAARQGARWMGLDPDSMMFKQSAALIIAAAKVGEKIGEAKFVDGGSAATGAKAPKEELADMANNPANEFYDALRHPEKNPRKAQEAQARQRKLGELIAKQGG